MRRLALGTLLLALCAPSLASPIYKWVDAQGTTHFGAQPPENVTSERVSAYAPHPGSPTSSKAATNNSSDSAADQAQLESDVKAQIAEETQQNLANCKIMRTSLIQLENNPRVMFEENGEQRRLGEDERQEKIAEAKRKIAEHCD